MDLINKIVNDIFTDGQNRKAKRLVLEFEGEKFNETGRNKLSVHSIIKKHLESNSGAGASYASPASSSVQTAGQDFNDMFWVLLQDLEHRIDPEKDLLSKRDVEAGYRIWNKIHKSELHARWNKS